MARGGISVLDARTAFGWMCHSMGCANPAERRRSTAFPKERNQKELPSRYSVTVAWHELDFAHFLVCKGWQFQASRSDQYRTHPCKWFPDTICIRRPEEENLSNCEWDHYPQIQRGTRIEINACSIGANPRSPIRCAMFYSSKILIDEHAHDSIYRMSSKSCA
jgi:hypothetical protein